METTLKTIYVKNWKRTHHTCLIHGCCDQEIEFISAPNANISDVEWDICMDAVREQMNSGGCINSFYDNHRLRDDYGE